MTVDTHIPALTLSGLLALVAACGGIRHDLGTSNQAPIVMGTGGNAGVDGGPDAAAVMGAFFSTEFVKSDVAKLDGPPGAGTTTTIAYPPDGALYPANFGPIT